MKIRRILPLVAVLLLGRASLAVASPDGGRPPHDRQPPGPPKAALEACAGKKPGDAVNVTTPDGRSVKAVCTLVAVPAERDRQPPAGERKGPAK